jgi:hypothetical protein
MNTNENPLENLEFFETFSSDDPIDVNPQYDPNKNIAADILAPDGSIKDPILEPDDEEEEEEEETPAPKPAPKPPVNPLDEEEEEEEEEQSTGLEDEESESVNYFEVFGKGLVKAGMLDLE